MTDSQDKSAGHKLAVIGSPVAHSLSPAIHRYWFDQLNIDATYEAVAVAPGDLAPFIAGVAKNNYSGLNVTLPHKEAMLSLADRVTKCARKIGAANTLVVGKDGEITADNTDADGFMRALEDLAPQWRAGDGPVLVLGAGGAARAICYALLDAGVAEVRIANRTPERPARLAADMNELFEDDLAGAVSWQGCRARDAALVINATKIGLDVGGGVGRDGAPDLFSRLFPDGAECGAIVFDAVYGAEETRLVKKARDAGATAASGLGMLLQQAALSFECWFGVLPLIDAGVRDAVAKEIANRKEALCSSSD